MYRQMRCSLLLVAVLGLTWTALASAADPNLVGWWQFDDGTGNVVHDESGNGLDGALYEGASIVDDVARGNVLCGDGVSGYASIPDNPAFDNITSLTMMFWMKLSSDFHPESKTSMAPVGKVLDGGHNLEFTLVGTDNSQSPKGAMYFKVEAGSKT